MYAVMTWGEKMPTTFPQETPQNSGNMVHAQAPFKMFPNSVGMDYGYGAEGYKSFAEFVNDRCEAVIIPFANTLRTDPAHDERGFSVAKSLDQFTVPVIPFGLGAQASDSNIDSVNLGPGMTSLVRRLSESTPAVSVRGEFTYNIFKKYGSVDNVHITGCPSFFSHPEAFGHLRERINNGPTYENLSFAGSLHHLKDPKEQLYRAIRQDLFLVEPVNAKLHQYYVDSIAHGAEAELPYFLKGFLADPEWNTSRLAEYIARRYRLFRDLDSWIAFNRESSDGAIGTRFHVNMASLISGLPAVWVIHDSRTEELCDKLSLPHVSVEETLQKPYREIMAEADYSSMFRDLRENFDTFNSFLRASSLPEVAAPTLD
ncbi:polysaccharide pyruvyl transferase family protein [Brachybacterium sp. Z12]|uniref:polysaccharide pyruvyl transferase family protein n=1 Tax=Brachybacterium sp. Z12 TaxID=2759167 RepID=UPI0018607646|nr:polysaccharide pyruvyl transferase family protein [Brachybacterium sp. Z12]QNN82274.1 polysaccharide pyruvyl transferase family protein [Brachybacterium sp. Z12]